MACWELKSASKQAELLTKILHHPLNACQSRPRQNGRNLLETRHFVIDMQIELQQFLHTHTPGVTTHCIAHTHSMPTLTRVSFRSIIHASDVLPTGLRNHFSLCFKVHELTYYVDRYLPILQPRKLTLKAQSYRKPISWRRNRKCLAFRRHQKWRNFFFRQAAL